MSFSRIKLKRCPYEDLVHYFHYHYYYISYQLIKSLNKVVNRLLWLSWWSMLVVFLNIDHPRTGKIFFFFEKRIKKQELKSKTKSKDLK